MRELNFSKNLEKYRNLKGLSKAELARRVDVSDVTIGYWEKGTAEPKMGKVQELAGVLGVTTDELIFLDDKDATAPLTSVSNTYDIPLYGSISAGLPIEMIEVDDYVPVPDYIYEKFPSAFFVRVNGDSMNKIIPPDAFALIEPCEEVGNGEVIAVSVDGAEATLKRFYRLNNTVVLEPDSYNNMNKAINFNADESLRSLKILGKLVWYMPPVNIKF